MNNANMGKRTDKAGKPKAREFFRFGYASCPSVATGTKLVNENQILGPEAGRFLEKYWEPGFSDLRATPKLRCTLAAIRRLHDMIDFLGFWLISEKMKAVLSEVDPEAFAFAPCEIVDSEGNPGPVRWLCDVVRVVDALDERASDARVEQDEFGKRYQIVGSRRLVFKDELIGPAHIFRMEHMRPTIICDNFFKHSCKNANLKVIRFINAIDPRAKTRDKWVKNCRKQLQAVLSDSSQHLFMKKAIPSAKMSLADALLELGEYEQGTDDLAEAVAIYRDILETEPDFPYRICVRENIDKAMSLLRQQKGGV